MSQVVTADEVEPESVDWLWQDRIPRSMLSFIAGRPDQGKGLVCARIAADVTKAGGNVLYCAHEDMHGLMTRPRLEAAGAVLKRVHLWKFRLPLQFEELRARVIERKIDLIVMDPLASCLTSGVSRHNDSIRLVTDPLSELIEKTGTAVIVVDHVNKRVAKGAEPMAAVGGSGSGFPAACRMGFLVGTDPDNEENKVLANIKSNVRQKAPAIFFEVDEVELDGLEDSIPTLVQDYEGPMDAIRLVSSQRETGKVGRPADKRAQAAEWLTNYLADAGEPVKASAIYEDALQHGMTRRTLRRAAQDMGVEKIGQGPGLMWDLPDEIKELLAEASDSAENGDTTVSHTPKHVTTVPAPEVPEVSNVGQSDDGGDLISDDDIAAFLEGAEGGDE